MLLTGRAFGLLRSVSLYVRKPNSSAPPECKLMEILTEMRKTHAKLKPKLKPKFKRKRNSTRGLRATAEPGAADSSSSGQLPRPELLAALPVLQREFYNRDPRQVARELLGKILVRGHGRGALSGRIVEVEVYLGENDLAAHAAFGITPRNAVLFGAPGHAYVYLSYGLHYCLNVSCMPLGDAGCVLFRAVEPLTGLDVMARNRGLSPGKIAHPRLLASGPARICQAFAITRARDNGKDLTSEKSDLQIVDDRFVPESITIGKRIGITKSPELPLRYYISANKFISR